MRFIPQLLLFLIILILTIFLIWMIVPYDSNRYEASLLDKHAMLQDYSKPRIILVGDSNLALGINSTLIENNFPEYRVINYGVVGAFGLETDLHNIKQYLRAGDVIIIAPILNNFYKDENYIDSKTKYGNEYYLSLYLDIYPLGVKNFEVQQLIKVPNIIEHRLPFKGAQIIEILQSKIVGYPYNCTEPDIFRRSDFDSHGDYIGHLNSTQNYKSYEPFSGIPDDSIFDTLNSFYNYCRDNGISVYYSYPPVLNDRFRDCPDELPKLQDRINNNLEMPVLGNIFDFIYPRTYFYNNYNHLNATGREVRTEFLIKKMKISLESPQ